TRAPADGGARAPPRLHSAGAMAPKLDCRAPCDFGRVESGGDRLLLAHIRAGFGLAVIAAAVRVVDHGGGIDPPDGVAGAIRFRENSARRLRWKRQRHRTAALAAALEPQPLTGSAIMSSFCSYCVKTNHERRHEKAAAPLGTAAELTRYAGLVSARSALKSQ